MNILTCPNIKLDMKYIEIVSNFYIFTHTFDCDNCGLTSLYGSPKIVRGHFYCDGNKLASLKYCPIEIYGNFNCGYNPLESLEHCPKYVRGNFWCTNNKIKFTEEYVRSICEIKGNIYV